jgi:hypothetical protein
MSYNPLDELAKLRGRRGTVIFPQPQPPDLPDWMKRRYIEPDRRPLPSIAVEDRSTIPAVTPTVEIDDYLREVQRKFDAVAEGRPYKLQSFQSPPGKIRVLDTETDAQGRTVVTRYVDEHGNVKADRRFYLTKKPT